MARLFDFDYKSPYFYMVTLKALKEAEAFSKIGPTGLIENEITKAKWFKKEEIEQPPSNISIFSRLLKNFKENY